jgi:para-aminobenzoate synthetase
MSTCADDIGPAQARHVRTAFWTELPFALDTDRAFETLFAASQYAFWLDGEAVDGGRSRWSYLGDPSGPNGAVIEYSCRPGLVQVIRGESKHVERQSIFDYLAAHVDAAPENPPPCPFVGGHVGWFGYELRNDCGAPTHRRASTPDALFLCVDRYVAVDHTGGRSYLVAVDRFSERERALEWIEATRARLLEETPAGPIARCIDDEDRIVTFALRRHRAEYEADINKCLEWIYNGETYQVCLTNEVTCTLPVDHMSLYRSTRRFNAAPYAAFIRWRGGAILSSSPEQFLAIDRHGVVETRPIKGTIARGDSPEMDRRLAIQLGNSIKDRAENVMIVDLLRNDLSRVCQPGTVTVPALFDVETYATLHQLVSTVRGVIEHGRSSLDVVRAAFPGGSMTGAPKLRTLQLIDALEQRARGVYSGALGWIGTDGAVDLSIVIRTIVACGERLSIGVGGGIVAQSTPAEEFAEMLLKASGPIKAIVVAGTGTFEARNYRIVGAG